MNETDNLSSGDEQSTATNKSVGSATSAVTLESNASHHPHADDYIHLTNQHCRRVYKIKSGSSQISVVCGGAVVAGSDRCHCTSHQSKARRLEGYFRRVPLKSGSAVINGKDQDYLSEDEWKALRIAEEADRQKELRQAAERLNTNENDDASPGVTFDFSANSTHPARNESATRNESGASTSDPSKSASGKKFDPESNWISGHERKDKRRSIAVTAADRDRLCRNGWNLVELFDTLEEAKDWLKKGGNNNPDSFSSNDDDDESTSGKKADPESKWISGHVRKDKRRSIAMTAAERDRLCRHGWIVVKLFNNLDEAYNWLQEASDDDPDSSSSDDDEPKKPSSKKSKKKSPRKSTRKSSQSSSSSSSSNSSSFSSSSTASDRSTSSESTREKKKKKKKSRRRRGKSSQKSRHKPKKAGTRTKNIRLFAKDPSTNDDQSVFGLKISDQDVGATLCPTNMSRKDQEKFAACITDVAAMPGTYHKLDDVEDGDKLETVFEGALAMMQQAAGKAAMITDAQWKNKKKSSLSSVKSHADLINLAEEIDEAEDPIFKQMDSRVRAFMQRRHYSDDDIDEYLSRGLWMRVAFDTLTYFKGLISAVKQQATSHDFENGMAEETLKYYSRKLVQIRMHSTSYQQHLLQTYAFLRDSAHNKFVNTLIFRSLLQNLLTQSSDSPVGSNGNGGRTTTNPAPDANQKCSHCGSKSLHEKMGVALGRNKCPFNGELSRAQAKKAAKEVLQQMQADPQADKKELIKAAIASHKAE